MAEQGRDHVERPGGSEAGIVTTVGDIMSPRCIRFGNQHQLREATWLMSELYRHTRTISPETLFLQRKLAGTYLLCARLGARVRARPLLEEALDGVTRERPPGASRVA